GELAADRDDLGQVGIESLLGRLAGLQAGGGGGGLVGGRRRGVERQIVQTQALLDAQAAAVAEVALDDQVEVPPQGDLHRVVDTQQHRVVLDLDRRRV